MGDTTKMDSVAVQRDEKGRVTKGALNAGGLSKEARLVRDGVRDWLAGGPMVEKFKEAYAALLDERNPVIVKDAADRLMGKVKETVEHKGEDGAPFALAVLTRDEMLKIARDEKP